ncbi:LUD domain-containing protein [Streptomyces sp. CB01881]|uniref:LutC/YkgG family protein n=1 Tax=Streptomyces sp. CB01881 TaxID=2078691 RepID=UPI000CDC6E9A|nr:LUD domain-containing protein [Streptomyces sp. CB01881]AUY48367.1 lactate utilization protein C [Streptomyces sp. CB01881]TYC76855.1 lactate utilization protein C [Streptomyces sp. CB01881]
MSSREAVLGRIRAALADVPADETPGDVPVPRDYRRTHTGAGENTVALFAERVADYRATVTRTDRAGLSDAIAAALTAGGVERLALPGGFPIELLPSGTWEWHPEPLNVPALDALDGAITLAAAGIAATGTIVLDAGPGQGRRALTLVPDYHLCILRAEQIADDVPDALSRLDPTRPLTFISGPSATSDIELDRVEGVHGPRILNVIIVDPAHPEQQP